MTLDLGTAAPAASAFRDAHGVSAPNRPEGRKGFLSDVIVELGFASQEAVDDAVETGRQIGALAEDVLIDRGELTAEQRARAIAERNGLPYVDLGEFEVDPEARRLLGRNAAARYRAIPIAVDTDGATVVALADPLDALAVSDIGVITRGDVRPAVACESEIQALIDELPEETPTYQRPDPLPEPVDAPESLEGAPEAPGLRTLADLLPEPAAAAPMTPTASEGTPPALQHRIMELVEQALDGVGGTELERVQAELESEREARAALESQRAEETAARGAIATALEEATGEIEDLASRLEAAEERASRLDDAELRATSLQAAEERIRELTERGEANLAEADDLRATIDGLRAEVDGLRAELAEAADERDREREKRKRERERRHEATDGVRQRLAELAESSESLDGSVEGLTAAVSTVREASERLAGLHRELGQSVDSGD